MFPVRRVTKADYDEIITNIEEFWGSEKKEFWTEERKEKILGLHNVMYLHEFTDTSYVMHDDSRVVAYLFGFVSEVQKIGYVSLVASRRGYKKQGLCRRLYELFSEYARARGCTLLRAVTVSANAVSIAFHTSGVGMTLQGIPGDDGVTVVRDYAGPGEHRVVFEKRL